MRGLTVFGLALTVLGLVVEVLGLGSTCTTNPLYYLPSAPSCSDTLTVAAVGAVLFAIGVVLAVTGQRSGAAPSARAQ